MRFLLIATPLIVGLLVFGVRVVVAQEGESETQVKDVPAVSVPDHLKGLRRISTYAVGMTAAANIGCGGAVIIKGDAVIISGVIEKDVGDVANPVKIANPARNDGPHDPATAVVHANDVALGYRRKNLKAHDYPVGSIFLKEKFISGDTDKLRLATVMERLKDEGKIDDWQFSIIMFPGGATEILRGNTAAACADCHSHFEKRGFLSQHTERSLQHLLPREEKAKASGAGVEK